MALLVVVRNIGGRIPMNVGWIAEQYLTRNEQLPVKRIISPDICPAWIARSGI
jgi:hypothetical protein